MFPVSPGAGGLGTGAGPRRSGRSVSSTPVPGEEHSTALEEHVPFPLLHSDRGMAAASSAFPLPGKRVCGFSVRVRVPTHERLQRGAHGSCGAAAAPAHGVSWEDLGGFRRPVPLLLSVVEAAGFLFCYGKSCKFPKTPGDIVWTPLYLPRPEISLKSCSNDLRAGRTKDPCENCPMCAKQCFV